MTPTTILIEREADAKVFEVLEAQYPKVKTDDGRTPMQFWDSFKSRLSPPFYINIAEYDIMLIGCACIPITAREWLAQHGYVCDGDGYREAPTRTEQPVYLVNKRWFYKKLLRKLNAILSGELNLMDYRQEVIAKIGTLTPPVPQPAPYTAGQEVEVRLPGTESMVKGTYDHYHNFLHYVKTIYHAYPTAYTNDEIRPVQVQPEVPEWEKVIRKKLPILSLPNTQLMVDELIASLRPLITPKQVTDDEIAEKWEVFREHDILVVAAIKLVRWALQKAEGGEG